MHLFYLFGLYLTSSRNLLPILNANIPSIAFCIHDIQFEQLYYQYVLRHSSLSLLPAMPASGTYKLTYFTFPQDPLKDNEFLGRTSASITSEYLKYL